MTLQKKSQIKLKLNKMQGITGGVEIAGQQLLWHGACFWKPAPMYEAAGSYNRDCSGDWLSIR